MIQIPQPYPQGTICITAAGCALPGAWGTHEYWRLLLSGQNALDRIPLSRLNTSSTMDSDALGFHPFAGLISQETIETMAKSLGISGAEHPRSHHMVLTALSECMSQVDFTAFRTKPSAIVLGCMAHDEMLSVRSLRKTLPVLRQRLIEKGFAHLCPQLDKAFDQLPDGKIPDDRLYLNTSLIAHARSISGLRSEGFMIDAACASSLAAIDVATQLLRSHEADMVIAGGVESNLAPETFAVFHTLNIASQGMCRPFDRASDGMAQGEGTVLFTLHRLEDAVDLGLPILAVIRDIHGASSGMSGSLFSSSEEGQAYLLRRVEERIGQVPIDFIECHGTGTSLGDTSEIHALKSVLGKRCCHPVPIGSVKALIGHTKATAGAASLLKCILSLQHRTLPPSPYFTSPIEPLEPFFVNTQAIGLPWSPRPLHIRIASSGFGGINYHMAIEEWKPQITKVSRKRAKVPLCVIAASEVKIHACEERLEAYGIRIPPVSLPAIDRNQIASLVALYGALERGSLVVEEWDTDRVVVLSGGVLGTRAQESLTQRLRLQEVLSRIDHVKIRETIEDYQANLPPCIEDTATGILNSVIATRISHHFGFRGKAFHVDSDALSLGAALRIATLELGGSQTDVVIILFAHMGSATRPWEFSEKLSCFVLTREELALKKAWPMLYGLHDIRYKA